MENKQAIKVVLEILEQAEGVDSLGYIQFSEQKWYSMGICHILQKCVERKMVDEDSAKKFNKELMTDVLMDGDGMFLFPLTKDGLQQRINYLKTKLHGNDF